MSTLDEERVFGMLVARNVFRPREVRGAAQRAGQATVPVRTKWNQGSSQRDHNRKQSEINQTKQELLDIVHS